MLRLNWKCTKCGEIGVVEDLTNDSDELNGACPNCYRHKGEVEYSTNMSIDEFLSELAKMNKNEIAKYSNAINICADYLYKY